MENVLRIIIVVRQNDENYKTKFIGHAMTAPLRRSQSLLDAVPRLRKMFQKKAKVVGGEYVFPLFPPSIQQMIWKTVPANPQREAAILVPLVSFKDKPSLLFTTRSSGLPTHQGEVAFPGGHFHEESDKTLEDTALREAQEELVSDCYPWDEVHILGRATSLPSINGTPVTPILAVLPHEMQPDTFPGCPDEVEDVFYVSLEELLACETSEPSKRFGSNMPAFPTEEGKRIWGLTSVVTKPLLHNLFKQVLLDDI